MNPEEIEVLQHTAETGDAEAMFQLGRCHDLGLLPGGTPNQELARNWYEKAARQGHPLAEYAIGNMWDYGEGGKQDHELARFWYHAAAMNNVRDAQMHFARMLQIGRGGYQSLEEAAEWYLKAVRQGDELAATNLANLHLQGSLANSSDEAAVGLLTFAADKLDGLAHFLLGELNLAGRSVSQNQGVALLHYCVAVLLLPSGMNRDLAMNRKEEMLVQVPAMQDEFESRALAYIHQRRGQLQG